MTAETLSAEERQELEDIRERMLDRYTNTAPGDPVVIDVLVDAVDRLLLMASEPPASSVGRDNIREAISGALQSAKLATPELLALGDAAVKLKQADERVDEWRDGSAHLAQHVASNDLFEAARAYAASVASIPTTSGVE